MAVLMDFNWKQLQASAAQEVESILAALPKPLSEKAAELPVTFKPRPNEAQCADGIEPDTLGLFIGPEFAYEETTPSPVPPQIILFLENIWDLTEGDTSAFKEEVRTTYLHELGHYLGLDEDDLIDRGLE